MHSACPIMQVVRFSNNKESLIVYTVIFSALTYILKTESGINSV